MIKRTLFFTQPTYLNLRQKQLVVSFPDKEKKHKTIPIEDLGCIVLENQQITLTNAVISCLISNKVAIINCNEKFMPTSLLQPLVGHSEQTERFWQQINMSKALRKNLWKQVIEQKIRNHALLLKHVGEDEVPLLKFAVNVKPGDTTNQEAIAAAYYWRYIFSDVVFEFKRDRFGEPPNNLLNYGYAIIRAMTARAVVSSGFIPSLGLNHKNKYNAFCLADDLMEPYRVYVDELVIELIENGFDEEDLSKEAKAELLSLLTVDVQIDGKLRPLMNALTTTTSSLYHCINGTKRLLSLPEYG